MMVTIGLLLIGGGCKGLVDNLFTPTRYPIRIKF